MKAAVNLILGPVRCGKSAMLWERYRAVLAGDAFQPAGHAVDTATERAASSGSGSLGPDSLGTGLWLAPNHHAVEEVRQRIADDLPRGCLLPGCYTFAQFADKILAESDLPIRPIDHLLKRQILKQVIEEALNANRLEHFAPIAASDGFLVWLDELISDLKRQEIWPEDFQRVIDPASSGKGSSNKRVKVRPKDRELCLLYTAYQEMLTRHHCYDAEGRFWSARELLRSDSWSAIGELRVVVVDGFTDFTVTQLEILEILARHVDELWISLPDDAESSAPVPSSQSTVSAESSSSLPSKKTAARKKSKPSKKQATLFDDDEEPTPTKSANFADRADLFERPRDTFKKLQARFNEIQVTRPARAERTIGNAGDALAHVEKYLFSNPRYSHDAQTTAGLEIWQCESEQRELELIAREIKRILLSKLETNDSNSVPGGVAPGRNDVKFSPERISVVFRSLSKVAPLVREVFTRYGIPFTIESGVSLGESPLVVALTSFLQLRAEDWPYRSLLKLVANNYFEPRWPSEPWHCRAVAETALRTLQVASGREAFERSLEFHLAKLTGLVQKASQHQSDDLARLTAELEEWETAAEVFATLRKLLDIFPPSATWRDWSTYLQKFAHDVGLLSVANRKVAEADRAGSAKQDSIDRTPTPCIIAWRQLLAALQSVARWEKWQGSEAKKIPFDQFVEELILIGQTQQLAPLVDRSGRVQVLSAPAARSGTCDYLFLAGLTEKSFPKLGNEDRLYSSQETHRFNESGKTRFTERRERICGEMLLFYEVLTRPTERLVMSYAALDAKAEPLSPSPFLEEVKRVCGKTPIATRPIQHLVAVPPSGEPLWSAADLRIRATASAIAGETKQLGRLLFDPQHKVRDDIVPAHSLLSALTMIAARSEQTFGPFEAMLPNDSEFLRGELMTQFGPKHCWSISQLEQYVMCPFQFFAKRVLDIEPLPDLTTEVDSQARGIWLHGTLARLHREWKEQGIAVSYWLDKPEEYLEVCRAALAAEKPTLDDSNSVEAAIHAIDQVFLERWLQNYLLQSVEYANLENALQPTHFEVSFGPNTRADKNDPLSTTSAWQFRCDTMTILVSGQIDRIDIGRVGEHVVFGIVDYKTGKNNKDFKESDFIERMRLQLPLYALAAEELLLEKQTARPWQIGYWNLNKNGIKPYALASHNDNQFTDGDEWQFQREDLRKFVGTVVREIQAGKFPMTNPDKDCTAGCDYRTVCRVAAARARGKVKEEIEPAKKS
jgi:ATP-dependent helicase/DNAse subunit B